MAANDEHEQPAQAGQLYSAKQMRGLIVGLQQIEGAKPPDFGELTKAALAAAEKLDGLKKLSKMKKTTTRPARVQEVQAQIAAAKNTLRPLQVRLVDMKPVDPLADYVFHVTPVEGGGGNAYGLIGQSPCDPTKPCFHVQAPGAHASAQASAPAIAGQCHATFQATLPLIVLLSHLSCFKMLTGGPLTMLSTVHDGPLAMSPNGFMYNSVFKKVTGTAGELLLLPNKQSDSVANVWIDRPFAVVDPKGADESTRKRIGHKSYHWTVIQNPVEGEGHPPYLYFDSYSSELLRQNPDFWDKKALPPACRDAFGGKMEDHSEMWAAVHAVMHKQKAVVLFNLAKPCACCEAFLADLAEAHGSKITVRYVMNSMSQEFLLPPEFYPADATGVVEFAAGSGTKTTETAATANTASRYDVPAAQHGASHAQHTSPHGRSGSPPPPHGRSGSPPPPQGQLASNSEGGKKKKKKQGRRRG